MVGKRLNSLFCTVSVLSLAACQGTTINNGGGTLIGLSTTEPPPPPFEAPALPTISALDPFNTAEFNKNYGLRSMGTHSVYDEGVSGAGVTVAIVDDGIDLDHPDLVDNISPLSIDILSNTYEGVDAVDPHGTQLAGIIAAMKNDIGIHGVAYNATILAIRAVGGLDNTTADVAAGIDYARENGAKVINLSVTASSLSADIKGALDRAVDAGLLIVLSAGNNLPTSSARASLDAISNYVTMASSSGQAIAVGAIDDENNLSFISNRPGEEGKDFYILAPGVDIVTTTLGGGLNVITPEQDPRFFGIDLDASGTSFAAPHVAGAAALMFEMFPNLTAGEVVELLLTSATDVEADGVDRISGHGIINLAAAIQPKGLATIAVGPAANSLKIPLTETSFLPSTVFGDAFSTSDAFDGGFFQDSYRRAYKFDFRDLILSPNSALNMAGYMKSRIDNTVGQIAMANGGSLQFSFKNNRRPEGQGGYQGAYGAGFARQVKVPVLSFASKTKLSPSTTLDVRRGYQPTSLAGFALNQDADQSLTFSNGVNSFGEMAGFGTSFTAQHSLGEQDEVAFSYSKKTKHNQFSADPQTLSSKVVKYKGMLLSRFRYGFELGQLREVNSFLNSQSFGAFGSGEKAETLFGSIAASYEGDKVSVFGLYSEGVTKKHQATLGLFKSFSAIRANAFRAGVSVKSLFKKNGKLTFSVAQPLRVVAGRAEVDIATSLNRFDGISRETRKISLVPKGRALDYSLAYQLMVDKVSIATYFMYRTNPGNVYKTPSDIALFLRFSSNF